MTVFVVQEVPGKNVLSARKFGNLEVVLPSSEIQLSAKVAVATAKEVLDKPGFGDDDYILAIGDPVAIGICCALAAMKNNGRFKILKWDRQESEYYEVKVDLSCAN